MPYYIHVRLLLYTLGNWFEFQKNSDHEYRSVVVVVSVVVVGVLLSYNGHRLFYVYF
jgi:hypothetical protein